MTDPELLATWLFATPQEVLQRCQALLQGDDNCLVIPSGYGDVICGLCGAGLGSTDGKRPSSVDSIVAHYRSCHFMEALCKTRNS